MPADLCVEAAHFDWYRDAVLIHLRKNAAPIVLHNNTILADLCLKRCTTY